MMERFWEWLRSVFGAAPTPQEKLENVDTSKLRDQIQVLDIERERTVVRVEKLQARRQQLIARAKQEQGVRREDTAKEILYTDQEAQGLDARLAQVHNQRDMLWQLVQFGERAELMRTYGVDKVMGQRLNRVDFERAVNGSVADGKLDVENLTAASSMLKDALAYTRSHVEDENLLQILQEIETPSVDVAPLSAGETSVARPVDPALQKVMREIDRE